MLKFIDEIKSMLRASLRGVFIFNNKKPKHISRMLGLLFYPGGISGG